MSEKHSARTRNFSLVVVLIKFPLLILKQPRNESRTWRDSRRRTKYIHSDFSLHCCCVSSTFPQPTEQRFFYYFIQMNYFVTRPNRRARTHITAITSALVGIEQIGTRKFTNQQTKNKDWLLTCSLAIVYRSFCTNLILSLLYRKNMWLLSVRAYLCLFLAHVNTNAVVASHRRNYSMFSILSHLHTSLRFPTLVGIVFYSERRKNCARSERNRNDVKMTNTFYFRRCVHFGANKIFKFLLRSLR